MFVSSVVWYVLPADSELLTSGSSEWTTATPSAEMEDTAPEIQRSAYHRIIQPVVDFTPIAALSPGKDCSGKDYTCQAVNDCCTKSVDIQT